MDYSSIYFGKPLEETCFKDVEHYFSDAKEESITIEFKSFSSQHGNLNSNIEGIIRTVCAFLNSEGGIVIWGAPEGSPSNTSSGIIFQLPLSPLNELKEKDWIINKISDSITPLPIGIKVAILQHEKNIVYVIEVQKSNYSPHQYKNYFWVRLDGQTKPAPHYLIEALFKRIRYPNIEGFIKLDQFGNEGSMFYLKISIFIFNWSELQNELNVSFRLVCGQGRFARDGNYSYAHDWHEMVCNGLIETLYFGAPSLHVATLHFNPQLLLSEFNNEVDLILSFGGRSSPLKLSSYKIDFSKLNWNDRDDPNCLFSSIEENILSSDLKTSLGGSREKTLKEFLKNRPLNL